MTTPSQRSSSYRKFSPSSPTFSGPYRGTKTPLSKALSRRKVFRARRLSLSAKQSNPLAADNTLSGSPENGLNSPSGENKPAYVIGDGEIPDPQGEGVPAGIEGDGEPANTGESDPHAAEDGLGDGGASPRTRSSLSSSKRSSLKGKVKDRWVIPRSDLAPATKRLMERTALAARQLQRAAKALTTASPTQSTSNSGTAPAGPGNSLGELRSKLWALLPDEKNQTPAPDNADTTIGKYAKDVADAVSRSSAKQPKVAPIVSKIALLQPDLTTTEQASVRRLRWEVISSCDPIRALDVCRIHLEPNSPAEAYFTQLERAEGCGSDPVATAKAVYHWFGYLFKRCKPLSVSVSDFAQKNGESIGDFIDRISLVASSSDAFDKDVTLLEGVLKTIGETTTSAINSMNGGLPPKRISEIGSLYRRYLNSNPAAKANASSSSNKPTPPRVSAVTAPPDEHEADPQAISSTTPKRKPAPVVHPSARVDLRVSVVGSERNGKRRFSSSDSGQGTPCDGKSSKFDSKRFDKRRKTNSAGSNSRSKSSGSGNGSSSSAKGDCLLHGTSSHTSEECNALKELIAKKQRKNV